MADVHKVWHELEADGKVGHAISDLIFVGETPLLVFEWTTSDQGAETPLLTQRLDPAFLTVLNWPQAKYGYLQRIVHPAAMPRNER